MSPDDESGRDVANLGAFDESSDGQRITQHSQGDDDDSHNGCKHSDSGAVYNQRKFNFGANQRQTVMAVAH